MSFVIINSVAEVATLPDGTLISWLPVMDDPSSEAVAFVRKIDHERGGDQGGVTTNDVWISPGNGWEPEPLASIVFPARIILLGVPQPGDYVPQDYLTSTDAPSNGEPAPSLADTFYGIAHSEITGGTYPRDMALQAASAITAQTTMTSTTAEKCIEVTLQLADAFADWLTQMPGQKALNDQFNGGMVDREQWQQQVDQAGTVRWDSHDA